MLNLSRRTFKCSARLKVKQVNSRHQQKKPSEDFLRYRNSFKVKSTVITITTFLWPRVAWETFRNFKIILSAEEIVELSFNIDNNGNSFLFYALHMYDHSPIVLETCVCPTPRNLCCLMDIWKVSEDSNSHTFNFNLMGFYRPWKLKIYAYCHKSFCWDMRNRDAMSEVVTNNNKHQRGSYTHLSYDRATY